MKYSVNIGDLTTDRILAMFLLNQFIQNKEIIDAEKTGDGKAVIMNGDEKQIKASIDVVRMKYHKNIFRFYESKNLKTWKRI